jgi:hypothetical protein
MVGYVSLNGHFRGGKRKGKAIGIREMIALAAVFAFLVIRNVPPNFPQRPSIHHSSISAVFNHGHRPHFDSDRLQWSSPAKMFFPFSPAGDAQDLNSASQVLSALQTKGFRYNRPPPLT